MILDHDRYGRPVEWRANEHWRRHRKALRDGIIACVLILLGWALLLVWAMPRIERLDHSPELSTPATPRAVVIDRVQGV